MPGDDWLTTQFEASRPRMHALAYRMLGSHAEADDAVQEAWLRLSRTDPERIENLGGLLTTVMGRVCLDRLRSRRSRREELIDEPQSDRPASASEDDPVNEVMLVRSRTLISVAFLDSAARTASIQEAVAVSDCSSSALLRSSLPAFIVLQ